MSVFNSYVEEFEEMVVVGTTAYRILQKKARRSKTYYRTDKGSILVEWGVRRNRVWMEEDAPRIERGLIYRVLRKADEETLQRVSSILPKDYFGEYTAEGHVINACRPTFTGSRFLSASCSLEGARVYLKGLWQRAKLAGQEFVPESLAVVVADAGRLAEHSIFCLDAPSCMKGKISRSFASAVQEVLIDGEIPETCMMDLEFIKLP